MSTGNLLLVTKLTTSLNQGKNEFKLIKLNTTKTISFNDNKNSGLEFTALLCFVGQQLGDANLPMQITEMNWLSIETHLRLLSKVIRLAN